MKTVTEYFRSPSFNDAVIHDDRTGIDTVIRYHDDCEDIVMYSPAVDLVLEVCG